MRGARSIRTPRRSKKAPPKKLARIGRVPKEGTDEAAAFSRLVAEAVTNAVKSAMEPYVQQLEALLKNRPVGGEGGFVVRGKLRYGPGFKDVWVGGVHYDLRERVKAQLCLQCLVEGKAIDASSALSLVDVIDPYVREKGDFPRLATIKIDDYFNDRAGKLQILRRELIASVRGDGRYFLKVD
jgi:hypothetical protein